MASWNCSSTAVRRVSSKELQSVRGDISRKSMDHRNTENTNAVCLYSPNGFVALKKQKNRLHNQCGCVTQLLEAVLNCTKLRQQQRWEVKGEKLNADPVWLVSIWRWLPQRNTVAPYVRTGVELEEKDALWCIPLDRPLTSCLSLQTQQQRNIKAVMLPLGLKGVVWGTLRKAFFWSWFWKLHTCLSLALSCVTLSIKLHAWFSLCLKFGASPLPESKLLTSQNVHTYLSLILQCLFSQRTEH